MPVQDDQTAAEPITVLSVTGGRGPVPCDALADDQFTVLTATTVVEAFERFEQGGIDCIVSNYHLPDADGIQFLQLVRADHPVFPFLLYTDSGSETLASEAIAAGVTEYVPREDTLATRVNHALEQYRSRPDTSDRSRAVLDAAPDAIVAVVDEQVVYANPATAALLGADTGDLVGTELEAVRHPDEPESLVEPLEAISDGETPMDTVDRRLQTCDDESVVVEMTARRVEWDDETGVVLVLRDSQHTRTRRELRERTTQLETVVDTAPAAIFVKDTDGRYLMVNDRFRSLFDLDGDTSGLTDGDLFSPGVAEQIRRDDQRVFEAGETVEVEEEIPVSDGVRQFLTRKTPLFEDGDPHALVAVATDVTVQKERETELRERVKELSAIHRTIELFETRSLDDALEAFVEALPQSFQSPDATAARIRCGDIVAATPSFVSREPRLSERTETTGGTPIELDVVLLEEGSRGESPRGTVQSRDEDRPFLPEEEHLVATLLTVVAGYVERRHQLDELQRYETTLKALGDPVYALDRDGNLTFANDALVDRTGYPREELLGAHVSKIITDAGVERGRGVIQGLLSTDQRATARWEMHLTTADGEEIPCENHVALLPFDEDGTFRGTAGVIRDVTDQRERERQLQRSRDHLLRTEVLADVGGWELDVETGDIRWTNGTRRIHEVTDEYEPTLEDALSFYHPDDRKTVERAVTQCRDRGRPFDLEVRLVTAAGRERWIQARGERVEESGTRILRGTIQDITDTKESEQQLMVLNRVLRHNLRHNLNVVTANAELLADRIRSVEDTLEPAGQSPDEMLDRLDTIAASAWELRSLADKARQLAETIEETDATERVDVSPLVTDLVERARHAHPDAMIHLDVENVAILGSPTALELAVGELLDNALTHTDRSSPTVSVTVSKPTAERVRIEIADDGPGIPEMERRALEEGAETPLEHGSGLGLWTVNWLSVRLGGHVDIADSDPSGTVVALELPTT